MTGPTVIEELLLEMDRNVRLLEEFHGVSAEEFLGDPHRYLLAERCFQLAIQCLVDICSYVASVKGWPKPEESRDAIILAGRQGVIPRDFSERIVGMAGFRNVLVHAYLGINRRIVYDYLSKLDEFRQFARHVELYLDGQRTENHDGRHG